MSGDRILEDADPQTNGDSPFLKVAFAITTVEDSFAHAGSYIIRSPVGGLVNATDLSHMACLPMGSRPIMSYPPRSRVLVGHIAELDHYVIIGSVPKQLADARLILPDSMVLRACVGQFQDSMHNSVFTDPTSALGNHSAGRPADTLPGDWGAVNDFGMAIFLGRAMASIRASDLAKVEAFWGDDLLRIAGYNMQLYTAGREEFCVNDEGEYNEVLRGTPFPWEALGVFGGPGDATEQKDGQLKPSSEEAKFEPTNDDQQIIARHLRLRGYLGDIEREYVIAPPTAATGEETFKSKTNYNGLLQVVKSSNGAYAVRSAKEITFEKYLLIPVPKEMKSPDDPLGANSTNYKAAGQQGTGEEHDIPEFEWGSDNPGIRAAQLFDYHAWFFSRYSQPGLHQHAELGDDGDWHLPEEGELTDLGTTVLYDKNLQIGHTFRAELPAFGDLVIDQREGHSVRYYRSRSVIKQLDDGGILLEDGYGSQLLMSGGNIELSCVGDVWLKPGRNIVNWAPHDFIARAGNSLDLSASKKDVRIKAERNMHVLCGNEKVGGMLFECRAEGSSEAVDFEKIGEGVDGHGITFKAAKSSFHAFARDVYVGRNQTEGGSLTIDAGEKGTLYLRGQDIFMRTLGLLAMLQASTTSPDRQMFAINQSSAVISTPMQIGGTVIIAPAEEGGPPSDLVVGGTVIGHRQAIFDGSILTNGGMAKRQGGQFVTPLDRDIPLGLTPDEFARVIREQVEVVDERVDAQEEVAVGIESTSPGNDDFQARVGFSCRDTADDLKLDAVSFLIFESRWQQMLRKSGSATKWDEPEVEAPTGDKTRPHPGQEGWETFEAYGEVENDVNFDDSPTDAAAKSRADMTEKGNEPDNSKLKDNYLVNVQV